MIIMRVGSGLSNIASWTWILMVYLALPCLGEDSIHCNWDYWISQRPSDCSEALSEFKKAMPFKFLKPSRWEGIWTEKWGYGWCQVMLFCHSRSFPDTQATNAVRLAASAVHECVNQKGHGATMWIELDPRGENVDWWIVLDGIAKHYEDERNAVSGRHARGSGVYAIESLMERFGAMAVSGASASGSGGPALEGGGRASRSRVGGLTEQFGAVAVSGAGASGSGGLALGGSGRASRSRVGVSSNQIDTAVVSGGEASGSAGPALEGSEPTSMSRFGSFMKKFKPPAVSRVGASGISEQALGGSGRASGSKISDMIRKFNPATVSGSGAGTSRSNEHVLGGSRRARGSKVAGLIRKFNAATMSGADTGGSGEQELGGSGRSSEEVSCARV